MDLAARFHAFVNSIWRPSDEDEVRRLHQEVSRRITALGTDGSTVAELVASRVAEPPLDRYVAELLEALLTAEGYFSLPRLEADCTVAELWGVRDTLKIQRDFLTDFDRSMGIVEAVVCAALPPISASDARSPFEVSVYAQIPELPSYLDTLVQLPFAEEVEEAGLFRRLRERLGRNIDAVDPKQVRLPSRHASSDPRELIDAYLHNTPFPRFLTRTVTLPVSQETFFSHVHVVGGSGAGKTQFLQNLILHHLDSEDPPALVVVDSQGELIPKLARLARFDPERGDLADRIVLISPRDIEYPPAINVFDVRNDRLKGYDAATREQVVAGVIQTFDYLFTGLLGADLTAKQSVFFRFVARLLISLPETLGRNATILDMIALMDDPTSYLPAIAELPPIQRRFFERDFPSKTFGQTREQIRYRLNAILENPTLERLFTAPATRLDILSELQRGAVILVDTDKGFLKGASGNFGRIFISLVLQAALERAALPEAKRTPAFLIVDEAAEYFDGNIDDLLTEARKYRLGCVFAHQYLDQCAHSLRASLAANTSIKLAAGVSTSDARSLAPDLRSTADFILAQPRGHFACYVRNVTGTAVSVPVPFGALERRPRMSKSAYRILQANSRARVALGSTDRDRGDGEGRPGTHAAALGGAVDEHEERTPRNAKRSEDAGGTRDSSSTEASDEL